MDLDEEVNSDDSTVSEAEDEVVRALGQLNLSVNQREARKRRQEQYNTAQQSAR